MIDIYHYNNRRRLLIIVRVYEIMNAGRRTRRTVVLAMHTDNV